MPTRQPPSLRFHLLALVAVVALPLLVFAAAMALRSAEQQQRAVEYGLVDTSHALAIAVENELRGTVSALSALATSPALDQGDLKRFYQQALRVRETQRWWYSIWLGDAEGRQILSLQRPLGAAMPTLADRDYFREAMRTKRPAVSGLLDSRMTSGHHIAVAVPVIRDGVVRYVLTAGYRPEGFADVLTSTAASPTGVVSLVDRNFRVVSRSRDIEKWVGQPAADAYIAAVKEGKPGVLKAESLEGNAVYVAVRPVALSGWTVGVGVPSQLIEGPRWQRLTVTATIGAAVLLLALALARWLGQRIVAPIASAATAAESLVRGAPLNLQPSNVREVMQLNRALEGAASLLSEKEKARRELEHERAEVLSRAEAARTEAEATNRAKDEFLAMFGHELRNPLAALSSAIHVLAAGRLAGDDARKVQAILKRQTDHLARLVDDLLDVARLTRGKVTLHRTKVNLAHVMRQALDCTRTAAEHKKHAMNVMSGGDVWVEGDETRLLQIVVNLVDNAIKYTSTGGHIAMRLEQVGELAVLTVDDDGPGIPPALLPHVFDLFTQGERSLDRGQGGLGLGLTISRRLVELHGGSIEAHNEVGRGAAFTVRLPAIAPPVGQRPLKDPPVGHRSRKVLIVEDNGDVRDMLRNALELDGHEVRTAEDGPQALDACNDWCPDVALLDIGLPGMNGYELAQWMRRTTRHVTLVAVTGYAAPVDRKRARAAGFDAHLSKPVDLGRLATVLDEHERPAAPAE